MHFTPSTNYNQFLPCPGLNLSRYGILHSERLGYQWWHRPLKMASTVYETEISATDVFSNICRQVNSKIVPAARSDVTTTPPPPPVRNFHGYFRIWVIDRAWGQGGWILVYTRIKTESVYKLAKKSMRPISSYLDRTSLVKNGLITWDRENIYIFCGT